MTATRNWAGGKRVTLQDVADRAQVSRALVSIVMREAPGASGETRTRVLEAAAELGYRPDVRARALAGTSSRLVGVVFGTAGSFHYDLLEGLYAEAEKRGYSLLLSAMTGHRDERAATQSLQDFQLDALVMLGPATATPLLAGHVPLVTVGWSVEHPMVDVIRTSDDAAMTLAVEHLIDLGHQRIAHIDGGKQLISIARREAYERTMTQHGLARKIHVIHAGESMMHGQLAAQALLRSNRVLPTAIIGFNDDLAVAALSSFTAHGIRVPEQVSLVGIDDSEIARDPSIELTSVRQDTHEMARQIMDRLEERLRNKDIEQREIILEPTLTLRESTGPAPARAARP